MLNKTSEHLKLGWVANALEDRNWIQDKSDRMENWSNVNTKNYNKDKSKHLDRKKKSEVHIGDTSLDAYISENELL